MILIWPVIKDLIQLSIQTSVWSSNQTRFKGQLISDTSSNMQQVSSQQFGLDSEDHSTSNYMADH